MSRTEHELLRVGDVLPDLQLPALDGGTISLGAFAGKKLILFMWASW